MSPALDRLRTEVALLDESERAQLAMELLESLDPLNSRLTAAEIEAEWNAEARRRLERLDRGEMATMSAEDVHAGVPIPDES